MPRVIITVSEENPQPYRFQLDRAVVTIGRGESNDIVVNSGSVSGKHAEMRRISGGYQLVDVGSTNGIKVNGVRHETLDLKSGMIADIGDVSFDFSLTEEELAALAAEAPPAQPQAEISAPIDSAPKLPPLREEAPTPLREEVPQHSAVAQAPQVVVKPSPFTKNFIILTAVLCAITFFYGASARHEKATGEGLLKAIVNKEDVLKEAESSKD